MSVRVDGWPQVEGSKKAGLLDKSGPASYTQVTTGSPPTGGQKVDAQEFGLSYLEHVAPALSDDGQYFVYFTPKTGNGRAVTSGILMWVTAAGGAEVTGTTDLSARTVRLRAIGL